MLKRIILILSILCIGVSSLFAQAKVGTTGPQFLLMSPSVKSNGMGMAGATVASNSSYYFNPANLGLLAAQNNISVSQYPASSKLSDKVSFNHRSFSIPFLLNESTSSSLYFGVAYYLNWLTTDDLVERTYERGTGTGRTFSWKEKSHNVVLSFARTGTLDFTGGITVKYIKTTTRDYSSDGFAFDVGGIVRYNIKNCSDDNSCSYIIPAVGLSVRNLGPDLTFISNSYPLPQVTTYSNSVVVGLEKYFLKNKTAQLYNLIAAIDVEKHSDEINIYKIGLDVSFYEILNVRVGKISNKIWSKDQSTYGFSISTFRIGKFKMLTSGSDNSHVGGLFGILYNRLNIEYNFANYDNNFFDTQNYHELVLSIAL